MTNSLVAAAPTSRTKRGMPPQARGMPRSISGMANRVLSAAMRRSQPTANRMPPPTQWPWMAAIVIASMFSTASTIW